MTGGYVSIDDVTLYYIHDEFADIRTFQVGPSYSNKFDKDGVCSFRITDLEAGEKYGFRVRGLSGNRFSPWSEVMKVEEGMKDPESGIVLPAGGYAIPEGGTIIFNLQGIRIAGSVESLPAGIYITNGKKVMIRR